MIFILLSKHPSNLNYRTQTLWWFSDLGILGGEFNPSFYLVDEFLLNM